MNAPNAPAAARQSIKSRGSEGAAAGFGAAIRISCRFFTKGFKVVCGQTDDDFECAKRFFLHVSFKARN